jgi:hypothetical protein
MAIAASLRNLVTGSGTVSTTTASRLLTFSSAQSFKEGTTIVVDPGGTPQYFTIDVGTGTSWHAMQAAALTVSGKAYQCSDTGTGRNRGTNGVIVPDAAHFCYRGVLDNDGDPDYYVYLDTLFPEKGLHPYTRDQYLGISVPAAKAAQMLIPDLLTRVRILEGLLRWHESYPGNIISPDVRLQFIEGRLRALELFANGGPAPSAGNVTPPTLQQAMDLGDA